MENNLQEMTQDRSNIPGDPEGSPAFKTIERIHKKIEHLRNILQPVISEVPPSEKDRETPATKLEGELQDIEEEITHLLTTVRL